MCEENCDYDPKGKSVHQESMESMEVFMSSVQIFMCRAIIVLGMVVAVGVVVHLTPLPDIKIQSCDRPCDALDWPMICRIKLQIGPPLMSSAQYGNSTSQCTKSDPFCIPGQDENRIILANNQLPAPAIQVCQNDIILVDVVNRIPDHSLTIHWRGQPNDETPFMDGVPLVTQCPITSFTTFQYKFRASASGTHYYHAHSHVDAFRGIHGAFIVRKADTLEPQKQLYDVDSRKHVVLVSEWRAGEILINGQGANLSFFNVEKGRRYRFRLAFTGGFQDCPVTISIENHPLQVIALDGNPLTSSHDADSITLSKGERVDFVVNANRPSSSKYAFKVESQCGGETGFALLQYDKTSPGNEINPGIREKRSGTLRKQFDTLPCEINGRNNTERAGIICLGDVRALEEMPVKLKSKGVDFVFYLSYRTSAHHHNNKAAVSRSWHLNNLTFSYPSSPLLTQLGAVSVNSICDVANVPEKCSQKEICECVHVEFLPIGSTAEIILIDEDGTEDEQIFHLHGHKFYLVASRVFAETPRRHEIKALDRAGGLRRHLEDGAPLKDTVRVPRNGVVALRFTATNSGFWILRDEKSRGWTRGMDMVFQVGDLANMVATPTDFPTCGNYIGPEFFLV